MTEAQTAERSGTDDLLSRVHLVGIGGAGMSGIARILLARDRQVSGSDARDSRTVLALRAQGAHVALGHRGENLDQLDQDPTAIVVSTAIRPDNPELVEAQRRGIAVLRRAEALAALMAEHRVACVAGTHGKTSTTSMLTVALQHCRLDPSFAIGGDLNESGANAHHGEGGVFVAEADESDGSFLVFAPSVAVVTNVEPDHLDHHGTPEAYTEVFDEFVRRIEPGGVLIVNADDPGSARLAGQAALRTADRPTMLGLLECARSLQGRPARPRSIGESGDGVLSEREREVAELVLSGLTYKQVGKRLFISAKTVEHHIGRIKQRLGASSREDLLARLRGILDS